MNSTPFVLSALLFLLLTPVVSHAGQQAAPPPADAPVARTAPPESVQEAPPEPLYNPYAPPVRERPHVGLRLLAEVGAGLLTTLPAGFLGLFTGAGLCTGGGLGCLEYFANGLLVGASLGFSLGVWWGGALVGNNGHVLGALSGTLLMIAGGLLGGGLATIDSMFGFGANFSVVSFIMLPLGAICSVVVYELTSSDGPPADSQPTSQKASRKSTGPRLQPTLSFSSRGALVGLGGTF